MGTAKHIGRIGALAVAPGIRNRRRIATRVTESMLVATLAVMATVVLVAVSTVSLAVKLSADSTALILCGTTCPTPDDAYIDVVKNQYIAPTHPGQDIEFVPVTAPMESWPLTGALRLLGLALGDPRLFGLGGPAWPDEPWWKLSGLFDLTADQSVQAGVADLEAAMAAHGNDHLLIYGLSQGAGVANVEKRKLAVQYPAGTTAPDIDFVLSGDPNLPNGGLLARFPDLYIPILDFSFNGPAATDTQFKTVEINRQYDGFTDFPLYPLNLVADLNAVLGIVYLHTHSFDVSLAPDASTSPAYQGTHGDTSYYFFQTQDLPLFAPLRTLGVPEPLIDVVEPFVRDFVELGYDRSIRPWEPTPARLIPTLDPAKVTADLVNAIGEGFNNAAALIGSPAPVSIPAPVTLAAPTAETARADMSPQVTSSSTLPQTQQVTADANGDRNPAGDVDELGDQIHQVMSTDTPTQTQQVSLAPADASESSTTATPERLAGTSTRKPATPADKPVKPRRVVRDSLEVGQQLPDRPHRGEDDQPTTRTSAAGAGAATGAHSSAASSSAASSSSGSSSRGASGGDCHGS